MIHASLSFPEISPFLIEWNGFGIRWYALAYIVGLLLAWRLAVMLTRRPHLWQGSTPPYQPEQAETLLFMLTLGVIVGGRLGHVLWYNLEESLADPVSILKTWEGGMSFHGGLVGVVIGGLIFCRTIPANVLKTADSIAVGVPFGLLFGRIANFINGELWGKPWDGPWSMVFPGVEHAARYALQEGNTEYARQLMPGGVNVPRHPSQLYEAGLEGLVLLALTLMLAFGGGLKRPGLITGVFLAGYGTARAIVEIFREPNPGLECVTPLCLQMGQVLSLPMIAVGLVLIALSMRPRSHR